jgi:hypothetical protein
MNEDITAAQDLRQFFTRDKGLRLGGIDIIPSKVIG